MKRNKNSRKISITIVIVLLLLVSILSYTYAYFAFTATNTNTITGDAGSAQLQLNVEKITPTTANSNLKLVPLLDSAIQNAVAGTGGNSSCIDANGNLSCQVYKITLTNTGTINLIVRGRISISTSGANNIFQNIKWRQLETSTQVKTNSQINGMSLSSLVDNVHINVNDTKIYYFAIWISEINENQNNKDYGTFTGTVIFDDNSGKGATASFTN